MNDKAIFRIIAVISAVIFIAVIVLNQKVLPRPEPAPSFVYFLPKLNAFLNGTCSVLLVASFLFIRQKKITIHKRINITAFALSSLFLVSYVAFHWMVDETTFGGEGWIRPVYFFILISHIILAAIVLPLVLISFHRGLQMQVEKHRKIVRWSFPIWLYVTITGVMVYLMISPYYNF